MWIGLLGPLRVRKGDRHLTIPAGRQRTLLAALVLHANHVVSLDALADAVWDGLPPPSAEVTLRNHIKRLRRCLDGPPPSPLATQAPGYLIQLGDDELDLTRFARLASAGEAALHRQDWAGASQLLSEALDLWRGTPLADIDSERLREEHVSRLDEQRLDVTEGWVEAELALGRRARLVRVLRDLISRYPIREHLRAQLMRTLAQDGRRAEALAEFQQARQQLVQELGIEPGPELQRVQASILAGDLGPGPPFTPPRRQCG